MSNKVSIIIPLYNRAHLILATLNSLYNQTYQNWEAIIVDDHSTDDSYKVVETEAKKDKRIKLHKRDAFPKGAPKCRNIGIDLAEGDYVVFLDSDDLLAPFCLVERLAYFHKNSSLDYLVFEGAFFVNELGDTNVFWNTFSDKDDLERFLVGDIVWQTSAPIWNRKSLISFELDFCELAQSSQDWEFHVKALLKGMSYIKVNGVPDYFVRRSDLQASNSISSEHRKIGKFMNRIQVYKLLFGNYELAKFQKQLLLLNVHNEIFNTYNKLDFKDLILLKREIIDSKLFKTSKVNMYAALYTVLYITNKITFNKSHQLYYYYRRFRSANNKNDGYRTRMSEKDFKNLHKKLGKDVNTVA